jgi:hypothetical protein
MPTITPNPNNCCPSYCLCQCDFTAIEVELSGFEDSECETDANPNCDAGDKDFTYVATLNRTFKLNEYLGGGTWAKTFGDINDLDNLGIRYYRRECYTEIEGDDVLKMEYEAYLYRIRVNFGCSECGESPTKYEFTSTGGVSVDIACREREYDPPTGWIGTNCTYALPYLTHINIPVSAECVDLGACDGESEYECNEIYTCDDPVPYTVTAKIRGLGEFTGCEE